VLLVALDEATTGQSASSR